MLLLAALTAPAAAGSGELALAHLQALSGHALQAEVTTAPWVGGDRVRLQPRVHGLPVLGATAVVRLTPGGAIAGLSGPLPRWPEPPPPRPALSEAAAIAAAIAPAGGSDWPPQAAAAWRVEHGALVLSWAVDFSHAGRTWRALVDDATGRALAWVPTSYTLAPQADIYPSNPLVSDLSRVSLEGLDGGELLVGEAVEVWSCAGALDEGGLLGGSSCETLVRHAAADTAGDFVFSPDPAAYEDPFAEVQLYYHLDLMLELLRQRWELSWPWRLRAFANFEMTNAFYGDFDGDGQPDVSFGQSPDGVDFAYDADVIYHELGHGVVDAVSDLGYVGADSYGMSWSPGALNEGTADAFSMAITGDPQLAEYAGSFDGRDAPIRDLEADRTCPEALVGEVHADGELWGALLWNLQEQLGAERSAELLYGAITTWSGNVSWAEAGQSLLDAAAALEGAGLLDAEQREAVEAEVDAADLLRCEPRVLPLGGEATRHYAINLGLSEDYALVPLETQFSVAVPARGGTVRFHVEGFETDEPSMGWVLFARRGAPVEHEVLDYASLGLSFAIPRVYDVQLRGTGPATLELGPDSEPAVEGGDTWYFSMASENLGELPPLDISAGVLTVSGEVEPYVATPEEPKFSCATGASPGGAGLALLGLAALARRRRRA